MSSVLLHLPWWWHLSTMLRWLSPWVVVSLGSGLVMTAVTSVRITVNYTYRDTVGVLVSLFLDHLLLMIVIVLTIVVLQLFIVQQKFIWKNLIEFPADFIVICHNVAQITLVDSCNDVLFSFAMNMELWIKQMESLIQSIKRNTNDSNWLAPFNF